MGKLFDIVNDLNKQSANKGHALGMGQPQPIPVPSVACGKRN